MPADQNIQHLSATIQTLVKQYAQTQKENKRLNIENERLKAQLSKKDSEIVDLNEKVGAARLNLSAHDAASKKELEKMINSYLKDIDHCLALLNT